MPFYPLPHRHLVFQVFDRVSQPRKPAVDFTLGEKSCDDNGSKANISLSKRIKTKWLHSPFRQRNVQTCSTWLCQRNLHRENGAFFACFLSAHDVQTDVRRRFSLWLGKGLSVPAALGAFALGAFAKADPGPFRPADQNPVNT